MTKDENKMTHEEAIQGFKQLKNIEGGTTDLSCKTIKLCEYAIKQLKQCEVFDEPVEMLVSDENDYYHKEEVVALFNGQAIVEDTHAEWYYIHKYCKPIKKEPLSFTEYAEHTGVTLQDFGNDVIEKCYINYQKYLNQFKP